MIKFNSVGKTILKQTTRLIDKQNQYIYIGGKYHYGTVKYVSTKNGITTGTFYEKVPSIPTAKVIKHCVTQISSLTWSDEGMLSRPVKRKAIDVR
jgi:hypothetical protein